jgi:hypothetical protein
MGRRGDAYDNAACESVISTLKNEPINRQTWTSRDQARLAVVSYIETFYNPRRRHSALGYRSTMEYENMTQEASANAAAAQPQRDLPPVWWSRVSRVLQQQGGFRCPVGTQPRSVAKS